MDYYADLSASVDNDVYFELLVRNTWHVSGGEGLATNTSCRRVLVIYVVCVMCLVGLFCIVHITLKAFCS